MLLCLQGLAGVLTTVLATRMLGPRLGPEAPLLTWALRGLTLRSWIAGCSLRARGSGGSGRDVVGIADRPAGEDRDPGLQQRGAKVQGARWVDDG